MIRSLSCRLKPDAEKFAAPVRSNLPSVWFGSRALVLDPNLDARRFGEVIENLRGLALGELGAVEIDADRNTTIGELGLVDVPVMVASGWSEAQKRAYVLADNELALKAGWDNDLLKVEIAELQALDFDLDLIGFGADEIAALTFDKTAGLTDPDEAPEAPEIPVSAPGDVWLLGKHRLVCGDCTDPLVVDKALNGVKPHLMVTDPPYGVEYDAAWRGHVRTANGKRLSLGVHAKGKVENDGKADWREAWVLFPGDVAYVWHAAMRVGESRNPSKRQVLLCARR